MTDSFIFLEIFECSFLRYSEGSFYVLAYENILVLSQGYFLCLFFFLMIMPKKFWDERICMPVFTLIFCPELSYSFIFLFN